LSLAGQVELPELIAGGRGVVGENTNKTENILRKNPGWGDMIIAKGSIFGNCFGRIKD
jgi:hypothetical protein